MRTILLSFVVVAAAAEIVIDDSDPAFELGIPDGDRMFKPANGATTATPRDRDGQEIVRWKLKISEGGSYQVLAFWPKLEGRWASNAPFTVMHREGQTVVRVDQSDPSKADSWIDLGTYNFDPDRKAQVILNTHANAGVIADRIKLIRKGDAPEEMKSDSPSDPKIVFSDDFSGGLQGWQFEGVADVKIVDGKLRVKTDPPRPGHMAFIRKKMPKAFRLEFDVTPISQSGFWLIFFCADSTDGSEIFAADQPIREGAFDGYVRNKKFRCYHTSYRRNRSPTCNLRKNPGMKLLKQAKLNQVMPQGKTYRVKLTYREGTIRLEVDGTVYTEKKDPENPYEEGYIALRNIYECETEYDNVVVYDLTDSE